MIETLTNIIPDYVYDTGFVNDVLVHVLDVLLVAWLIYRCMLWVRGTRAQPMIIGMLIIGVVYVASRVIGLVTLNWILGNFLGSVILVIVILFQEDFRRALINLGLLRGLSADVPKEMEVAINEIAHATTELSEKKVGALIVIARDVGLQDYSEHAVRIEAVVTHQLLQAIFHHTSPIHDGAVIVEGGRIVCAGAVLPLTFNPTISKRYGTRHRAAIGLSERTDAIVVVVSEETGGVSMIREGKITKDLNEKTLANALNRLVVVRQTRRQKLLSRSFVHSEKILPKDEAKHKPEYKTPGDNGNAENGNIIDRTE